MTETLISLISISFGIIGGNSFLVILKKYSFGFTGNSIGGVFGSIFFIKSFGRLGFDPNSIMQTGNFNLSLFIINCIISFCGGFIAIILIKKLQTKMNMKKGNNKIDS